MIQAEISQRDTSILSLTQLVDSRTADLNSLQLSVCTSLLLLPYPQFNHSRQFSNLCIPRYKKNPRPMYGGMIFQHWISMLHHHPDYTGHLMDHTCGSWSTYIDNIE